LLDELLYQELGLEALVCTQLIHNGLLVEGHPPPFSCQLDTQIKINRIFE